MEQPKKYTIKGVTYTFKLSLLQNEMLGSIMFDLVKECPEALGSQNEIVSNIKNKFDVITGSQSKEQKAIMDTVQEQVIDTFQNIIKIKLRNWLRKNNYERRMLAILLVPEGKDFNAADVPEIEDSICKGIDLLNPEDAAFVDSVIEYFFMKSGVSGLTTPQSLGNRTKI